MSPKESTEEISIVIYFHLWHYIGAGGAVVYMENLQNELKEMISRIQDQNEILHEELKGCPKGELQCYSNHGRKQFTQVWWNQGKRNRKYINRNKDLIRDLARKKYLNSHIEALSHNIDILSNACKELAPLDHNTFIASLPSSLAVVPREFYLVSKSLKACPDADTALKKHLAECQKWATQPYNQSNYNPQQRKITTSQGIKVRSKSEALIADMLHDYGIPFRYEQVIRLDQTIISPDFSFLSSRGFEVYWEHAGLLDNPFYSFRHHLKMMQYETAGIYPWRDLIVTYDTDNQINMKMIKSMIHNVLLPAL